ncbi:adenosylcobinamide-GDP ribazoletransferase [Nocardioides litoris]|uniref:adenosylcobinamide-GDP ribazoletransferase n=1 Tax=Nocardioides litoris TaxID=1926648 RepID=UPI001FEAD83B|nr:adenosylcobinamide-GDP ribazoletransferase [Nocardioides litoris]
MPRDLTDAWRLATGLLTALPVRGPHFDGEPSPAVARATMLLAPVAVLPLGALVAAVLWLGDLAGLPSYAVGLLAVGAVALGTRALHWDGLSDVADGLTASYDPERSLAVMKTGTSGPAGTLATVLVAGLQAAALAALADDPLLAGGAVCLSRCALWIVCASPVPPARWDGIGGAFTRTVPVPVAVVGGVLTGVVPGLVVVALVRRCTRRLGGVTGDVMGAAIELCLTTMLLGLACA